MSPDFVVWLIVAVVMLMLGNSLNSVYRQIIPELETFQPISINNEPLVNTNLLPFVFDYLCHGVIFVIGIVLQSLP